MPARPTKPPRIPPTPIVKRALAVRSRLRRLADAMIPPQGITVGRMFLLAEVKMLGVACELRIPEAIDDGVTTAESIAGRVGARPDATERCCASSPRAGWFTRTRDGRYGLNARSRALRADDEQSCATGSVS